MKNGLYSPVTKKMSMDLIFAWTAMHSTETQLYALRKLLDARHVKRQSLRGYAISPWMGPSAYSHLPSGRLRPSVPCGASVGGWRLEPRQRSTPFACCRRRTSRQPILPRPKEKEEAPVSGSTQAPAGYPIKL
jgi:hypothetical protein